jgi:hypothetical protein
VPILIVIGTMCSLQMYFEMLRALRTMHRALHVVLRAPSRLYFTLLSSMQPLALQ